MKYPCLVPKQLCKTDIDIVLYSEDIDENGSPIIVLKDKLKCNYQDKSKQILTPQKQLITISGTALLPGDIAPELATISGGKVIVYGVERNIYQGTKARNPDGTVNYTKVELE